MKFRYVDKIVSWEADSCIRGIKAVSFEEYCLRSRLGYPEALPETIITQSFISLADWLVILSSGYAHTILVEEIETVRFHKLLKPGERLHLEVQMLTHADEKAAFQGIGIIGSERAVEFGVFHVRLLSLRDFYDSDDLQTLFSEIYQPPRSRGA